jgi:hypothetical protein
MQYAHSAAASLEVNLVKLTGARPARDVFWLFVGTAFSGASDVAWKKLVVSRIGSGVIVAESPVYRTFEYIVDEMRHDLPRLDEAAWIERWGNPSRWPGAAPNRR